MANEVSPVCDLIEPRMPITNLVTLLIMVPATEVLRPIPIQLSKDEHLRVSVSATSATNNPIGRSKLIDDNKIKF
jgi:hypothetical protein